MTKNLSVPVVPPEVDPDVSVTKKRSSNTGIRGESPDVDPPVVVTTTPRGNHRVLPVVPGTLRNVKPVRSPVIAMLLAVDHGVEVEATYCIQ